MSCAALRTSELICLAPFWESRARKNPAQVEQGFPATGIQNSSAAKVSEYVADAGGTHTGASEYVAVR
jgi:hypothetical protein